MTPETFSTICSAIYGSRWQSDASRALGIPIRSIQFFLNGERGLPRETSTVAKLVDLTEQKAASLGFAAFLARGEAATLALRRASALEKEIA